MQVLTAGGNGVGRRLMETATGDIAEKLYVGPGNLIRGYAMYPDGIWSDFTFFRNGV